MKDEKKNDDVETTSPPDVVKDDDDDDESKEDTTTFTTPLDIAKQLQSEDSETQRNNVVEFFRKLVESINAPSACTDDQVLEAFADTLLSHESLSSALSIMFGSTSNDMNRRLFDRVAQSYVTYQSISKMFTKTNNNK